MKLHESINVVERSGEFEESQFSIQASAKAFFILSDGLYSNKIKAVIRELSTNAYDAHVENGNVDTAFDIQLPNRLEPIFSIRDYGTGMSHDECMHLYTSYFNSTKTQRNDSVGCLGLGSKSPFAYTDQFMVESFQHGMKRTYTAYKNEDGNPVFALLHEQQTDEPNGVRVNINVDEDDCWKFVDEAEHIYTWFKVKPNVTGRNITIHKYNNILSNDNWQLHSSYDNIIVMGNVAYPIDEEQIDVRNIHGVILYTDIGDVDITPSRESLSYTKQTKDYIVEQFNNITNSIADSIQKKVNLETSMFRARMTYFKLSDKFGREHSKHLHDKIEWNSDAMFPNMNYTIDMPNKGDTRRYYKSHSGIDTVEVSSDSGIYLGTDFRFIYDDLKRGGISRTKNYMLEEDVRYSQVYLFRHVSIDHVMVTLGCDEEDLILTSSLPEVTSNRRSGGGGSALVRKLAVSRTPSIKDDEEDTVKTEWVHTKVSVKEQNAYYIVESRGQLQRMSANSTWLLNALKCLNDHGVDVSKYNLYMMTPSKVRTLKLEGRNNWTEFTDVLVNEIKSLLTKHQTDIDKYVSIKKFDMKIGVDKVAYELPLYHKLHVLCRDVAGIKEKFGHLSSTLESIIRMSKAADVFSYNKIDFQERLDTILENYPMFESLLHSRGYWGGLSEQEIKNSTDYIQLMDKGVRNEVANY